MSLKSISLALLVVLAGSQAAQASTLFNKFTPLPSSVAAGALPESEPFQLSSPNFSQRTVAANDRGPQNGGVKLGDNWDMITLNENGPEAGRYLFTPYETGVAGVLRLDLVTGNAATIVPEGAQGFVAGDASRWTPWGSYLTAEESWASATATAPASTKGRLFEVPNPLAAPSDINFVWRTIIPRISHEGLAFDKDNNFYFIDELNGGSIYRYTSVNPKATSGNDFFSAGQTSVLKVAGGGIANAIGAAVWEPLTTATGTALPAYSSANLPDGTIDARLAANLALGTDYQRPEDLEIQNLDNGSQILYVATTTTNDVFSILLNDNNATVNRLISRSTIDEASGLPVGSALTSPDNLAIDAEGNIYVVEDQGPGAADIWFARDTNRDGVAESMGRWATMATRGAEPTGLYFSPFDSNVAYVNIQHADSDVDRTIEIKATPEPGVSMLSLAGLTWLGAKVLRRKQK